MKENSTSRRTARLARGLLAATGLLAAAAAHAQGGELAATSLRGILQYFADPENVRGVFGAAAGALAAVLAARPLGAAGDESDDR